MSVCGGEILRAVMEKSSVYSAPAFYTITLSASDGTANARATQRGFFRCNKDRWFMTTGIVPTGTQSLGFERIDEYELIRLFDPSDNSVFALNPPQMQAALYSESALAFMATLPEYIVWEPNSLIGLEWTGKNFNLETGFKFLTLVGIEYQMKG